MRSSGLVLAMMALLAAMAGSVPSRAEEWRPFPVDPDGARMSLGLRAERWQPEQWVVSGPRPKVRRRSDDCRKWRSVADRLGETFAGWTLRNSVLRRVCGLTDGDSADGAWEFPWGALAHGRVVPPRHMRTIGAWDIRCGWAGPRRRCALVAELGPVVRGGDKEALRPVVHFVIDMVGGREALLWRLFVPAEKGTAVTELGQRDDAKSTTDAPAATPGTPTPTDRRGWVRYRLGDLEHEEAVPACAAAGCLMEANVLRAGTVATRLWDGHGIDVAFEAPGSRRVELQLPAAGFRAAFTELVRLRRDERRGR